jgi:S1/P1 Nuclease
MRTLALVILGMITFCGNALAWGDHGHQIVCEIAMRLAEPDARAAIRKLIAADKRFDFFSDSCTFPDHLRTRAEDHFVNLPRSSHGLTTAPCPNVSDCVVTAIQKDFAVLSSKNASQKERLLALKYLGHWVGDVHQPLNVSFKDDRGGNDVDVTGECSSNLHSAWDTCLVLAVVSDDVEDAATDLMKTITPAKIEKWTDSDPTDWANESFSISVKAQTRYCIQQGASCNLPPGSVKVDSAYIEVNGPVVREQLQKAGVRLAHLLDAALGNSAPSGHRDDTNRV